MRPSREPSGRRMRSGSHDVRIRGDHPRGRGRTDHPGAGGEADSSAKDSSEVNVERSLTVFLVVLVVVFLLAVSSFLIILIINNGSDGPDPSVQTHFVGGSGDILVNSTYEGDYSYIELPRDATVVSASMSASGSLRCWK